MIKLLLSILLTLGTTTLQAKFKIAVIDSGFNNLSFFTDRVPVCKTGHYNFITERPDLGEDSIGHGTIVTKLINDAARVKNHCFVVIKVFGGEKSGASNKRISRAIYKAVKSGARVINMSLGGIGRSYMVQKALRYAGTQGVRIFVAAGNSGLNLNEACTVYPACSNMRHVIVVGALNILKTRAVYSNYGLMVDDWAYGQFGFSMGTSFAAPRVAGRYVRSLIKEKK